MVAEVGAAWKRKAHLLALYSRVCPKRCDMTSQIAIRTHTHCINDHAVICARMCAVFRTLHAPRLHTLRPTWARQEYPEAVVVNPWLSWPRLYNYAPPRPAKGDFFMWM